MYSARILNSFERCPREAFYSLSYESQKISGTEMLYRAVRAGLTTERGDFGECAGEEIMALAEHRGLDSDTHMLYDVVCSLAAVADLVTCAIRKPGEAAWGVPENKSLGRFTWESSLFQVEGHLRRVLLVSSWSDSRRDSELRSWYSAGESSVYEQPIQTAVVVVGQDRNGRRQGPFTKAMMHPQHRKQIRFRKRSGHQARTETFKETWREILRVDHAEITTREWLEAMMKDDVLREVAFHVDVPVPSNAERIREMAIAKLERLYSLKKLPEANLSSCARCQFRRCCWGKEDVTPSEKRGYISLE